MRCPKCTSIEDKVIDSRISREGSTIRRRRECLECGIRFSTTESMVRDGLFVIKRDGRREDFDREKVVHAIRAACHKRPVDLEQIGMVVEDVVDIVEAQYESEIPSKVIGESVMQRLRTIDQVAYVRFASVYKEFRDVKEFMQEISSLPKSRT
ncbi:MAG: transcriptional regulator NrdR [Opitutaceae bacterium]|jgi:transcriptional repressor NrdR|nr:transcriptional regulator NrdR [Opitutaceae bacterium]|tara:strand:- start:396 stop:854 length:459 start_codon:yes stop_codon:yes gene_type:complete